MLDRNLRCKHRLDRRAGGSSETKLFSLAVKRAGVDAQNPRGFLSRFGRDENPPDVLGLELLERDRSADLDWTRPLLSCGWRSGTDPAGKIVELDLARRDEEHSAFQGVAQLAQVARPGIVRKCPARLG